VLLTLAQTAPSTFSFLVAGGSGAYVVTVNRKGQAPATFPGALSGPGDRGDECLSGSTPVYGTLIVSFDVP
jgi:hypothetical protein